MTAGVGDVLFMRSYETQDHFGDFHTVENVYVVSSAGGRERRLTPANGGTEPAWSPDGRRIAFIGSDFEIYVVNADGSGLRRLTRSGGYNGFPAWSPDGERIAFRGGKDGRHLVVINVDGTRPRVLITLPAVEAAAWSRDGQRIAFYGIPAPATTGLYVVNGDGTAPRKLASCGSAPPVRPPAWSPDGRTIAFDCDGSLAVIHVGGTTHRKLSPASVYPNPVWSPDGRRIAFQAGFSREREIYVISAEGTGKRRLTPSGMDSSEPAWSPDGRTIAFVRHFDFPKVDEIYLIKPDGTGQRRLTYGTRGDAKNPHWRPFRGRRRG